MRQQPSKSFRFSFLCSHTLNLTDDFDDTGLTTLGFFEFKFFVHTFFLFSKETVPTFNFVYYTWKRSHLDLMCKKFSCYLDQWCQDRIVSKKESCTNNCTYITPSKRKTVSTQWNLKKLLTNKLHKQRNIKRERNCNIEEAAKALA